MTNEHVFKINIYCFSYNAHGDAVQLTDESGAVTKDYHHDAFGVEIGKDETDANPWRYCGEYWDEETGTVCLRARSYSPGIGRFSSEDTNRGKMESPLSLNLYTYCRNNPIIFFDPTGHTYGGNTRLQNLAELNYTGLKVDFISLIKPFLIANWARDEALNYAKAHNWYEPDGTPTTWDNEADAYRHFIWNAKMTMDIRSRDAEIVATYHEMVTYDYINVTGGKAYIVPFDSLMDANNNYYGRLYADMYPELSYSELFDKAFKDGVLITSLDQVATAYNLQTHEIFIGVDGKSFIYVYVPDK